MGQPERDCSEDGGGAVDDGEFVVSSGRASPLLDDVEAAFDDVAALVVCGVEGWWASSSGAPALAVRDLVGR